MELKRPMLAASTKGVDLSRLKFPLIASPKIDGVRALVVKGKLVSRTLKEIPNRYAQARWSNAWYEGLDGELTCGPAHAHNVMQATMSGVMSEHLRPEHLEWNVFDDWTLGHLPFSERAARTKDRIWRMSEEAGKVIRWVPHTEIVSYAALVEFEEDMLDFGWEGIMLRRPDAPYKQGRSTLGSRDLLKVKRFEDGEAEIIGATEQMHNGNAATVDERGFTKRSTHAAGKARAGCLGSFTVRDLKSGVIFEVGTGFTQLQRDLYWSQIDSLIGSLVKYQHFAVGAVDKPRFPIFLGFRDRRDV